MIKLHNTLTRKVEDFNPIKEDRVSIYTCGPTVYDYQHIGNYTGYIYWDLLIRLLSKDFAVKRIMNITDVGHLVSDDDEGEDKLEKGAKREGKTARQVADFYMSDFLKSMELLGLIKPDLYAKATDYIPTQIKIIDQLLTKGFAYQTEQAIYFDVSKLEDYGKLNGQKLSDKEVGAREEVVTDSAKAHPQDFALWFFRVGRFADHEMHWPSPWGNGFPGWHLECSAIIHETLGEPIDIHTGGVDHIGTHHTNEMAQSEAAFDTYLSNFWLHNNHMMVNDQKISKSLGNGFTLQDLADKGFSAYDFKFLVFGSHYRSQTNFTWESLAAARQNLADIRAWADLIHQPAANSLSGSQITDLQNAITNSLSDDLNSPEALAAINVAANAGAPTKDLLSLIDVLFGLDLTDRQDITQEQKHLIFQRQQAREASDWDKSDQLRGQLSKQGIEINDTSSGPIWRRV